MTPESDRGRPRLRPRITCRRTPDGRRIDVSRPVAASADRVWRLLTDTRYWPSWGPSVVGVDIDDPVIDAGSRGRVRTPVGVWIPFSVIDCADYRWTWRVAGIRATGHRVDPAGPDRCRVAFEVPLWAPWYLPVVWLALRRIARLARSDAAGDR